MRLLRHVVPALLRWQLLMVFDISTAGGGRGAQAAWIPNQGSIVRRVRSTVTNHYLKPLIHFRATTTNIERIAYAIHATSESLVQGNGLRIGRLQSKRDGEVEDIFVGAIGENNPDEIEEEATRRREARDLDGLNRLLAGINLEISKRSGSERDDFIELRGSIKSLIRQLQTEQVKEKDSAVSRVADITVGLKESLKHYIDLRYFERRVLALFRWHDGGEMDQYMAPYMPVIQSSGTGKTRLFMALREAAKASTEIDYDCMTILCLPENAEGVENREVFFDRTIRLRNRKLSEESDEDKDRQRDRVRGELEALLSTSTKNKLVLLFDEAQHLLRDEDGADFRCVRWWLREQREKQVVAVFAGTTSKLANFYRDTPPTGFSRNPGTDFANWVVGRGVGPTKLYDPFFRICTIGCFQKDVPDDGSLLSEFERAAFYGRPLFAYLQKSNKLLAKSATKPTSNGIEIASSTLHGILKRMLLSDSNWKENKAAICSVLGSRVQMGVTTSFVISSDLVSRGYAHLVHFTPDETNDLNKAVARVTFMPDPVCAALAMGLMHEKWAMTLPNGSNKISGQGKQFWSNQAMLLLASGLCLPEKGNAGEVMTALYILYCGDVLRFSKDQSMRTFSVPLFDWYLITRTAINESQVESPSHGNGETDLARTSEFTMDVNFIQVCRNYFRAHSWKTQQALKLMYMSACASYVYPACKAIDLVAVIRVVRDGKPIYHPLLVSVKCSVEMSQSKIKKAIQKMKSLLFNVRQKKAKKNNHDTQTKTTDDDDDDDEEEVDDYGDDEEDDEDDEEAEADDEEKVLNSEENNSQELDSMNGISNFEKCPPALCLLFVIGAQKQPDLQKMPRKTPKGKTPKVDTFDYKQLDKLDLGGFPNEDTFRLVTVPTDDPFDISRAIRDMTTVHEMTEIFSSHGFVYGEDATVENRRAVLRKTRLGKQPDEPTKFVINLFDDFSEQV